MIVEDEVVPLRWGPGGSLLAGDDGATRPLADLLAAGALPPLEQRFPVLTYGANRNPGTILLKLAHYGHVPMGTGTVVPVLSARLRGHEAVAGGLSAQGYLFADLHAGEHTAGTELAVHVMLLDAEQLRVMHDSEGVHDGNYDVVRVDGVVLDGHLEAVPAMAYAGKRPVFVSPEHGTPVAFEAIGARGRRLPAYACVPMLTHALTTLGLSEAVAAAVAPGLTLTGDDLGHELMAHLNGQWWYRWNTGRRRTLACEQIEALVAGAIRASGATASPSGLVGREGARMQADDAYDPGPGHMLASWWR